MTQKYLTDENCVFCLESVDPSYANKFLSPSWPFCGRVLYQTKTTLAIPGYGPQVFPYALVLTKRHILSLAQTTEEERDEIFECLNYLLNVFRPDSESFFVFEHAGCRNLDSCLEHFHLHVVDGKYNLRFALADKAPSDITVSVDHPLMVEGSYLFGGLYSGQGKIEASVSRIEQKEDQFFRRVLAETLGNKDWDWRLGMNFDLMLQMMIVASDRSSGSESHNYLPR